MPGVRVTEGAGLLKVFIFLAGGVAFREEREIALAPVPPAFGSTRSALLLECSQSGHELRGVRLLELEQLFLLNMALGPRLLRELGLRHATSHTKLE